MKTSQIWVKAAIGSGILLGLVLLGQTIATYFFVYGKVIHDEAAREVERKEASLLRSAISSKLTDIHQFGPLLTELQRESPKQIAWVRIYSTDLKVIAQVGSPTIPMPTPDQLRQQFQMHQSRREIIKSSAGDILVVNSRLRLFGRPTAVFVYTSAASVSRRRTHLLRNRYLCRCRVCRL
jgi:uncharacterized membrane protein YhiD involved in acid resistance